MSGKDYYDRSNNDSYGGKDFYNQTDNVAEVDQSGVKAFVAKVYGWMFIGLLVTTVAAFGFILGIQKSEAVRSLVSGPFMICVIIAELVLVFGLTLRLQKMAASTAKMTFLLYALLNGITISFICLQYTGATVTKAFLMAAIFFGVMSVYGLFTQADLSKFGTILIVALISLILASVVNMFMHSSTMDYIICLAGLGIFAGLTAWDAQKIKSIYYSAAQQGGSEVAQKMTIMGALALYLDFINIFIYLLRLLGRRD